MLTDLSWSRGIDHFMKDTKGTGKILPGPLRHPGISRDQVGLGDFKINEGLLQGVVARLPKRLRSARLIVRRLSCLPVAESCR
ncbi:MAG: hypothetical protein H0W43_11215 [Chthoniobacterales bacterium]|nr:hypothetical protein [Chthoniobacterales bacterium]